MTAAQKKVAANFKKALAIRKATGCSLKDAFAKVYGKKTAVKKAAPKKVARKKAAPKKVARKKAVRKKPTLAHRLITGAKKYAKKIVKKKATRKPTERDVLKSIKHSESVQKKHMMSGINSDFVAQYKKNNEILLSACII